MRRLLPIVWAVVMAGCGWALPAGAAAEPVERPNILFIITDDQAPHDFGFYEPNSVLEAPVLDRLASEGVVVDRAFHMGAFVGAVCRPSRHMVMSGRTVWHVPDRPGRGNNPNESDPDLVPPNLVEYSLPALFNAAGYETMRTCKIGNSFEAANERFDIRRDETRRDPAGNAWHADQVLDYLDDRERRKVEEPFLIYLGFSHPHDPRNARDDLLNKYGAINHRDERAPPPLNPEAPPLPANYLPEHPFHHGHPDLRDEVAVEGVWEHRDEATIRNEYGRQLALAEDIDTQVGRVVDRLEQQGELDNTYIFYTSDHGMAIGRHGLQGKQNLYDHTWRVPMVAAGPGIEAGTRAPGNIYLLDVLATLCDLAGIETPATNEGLSFKPVLFGEQETVRDVVYGVYAGGTRPGIRAVQKGNWKLVKWDVLDGQVRRTQLFDLQRNPYELLEQHHSPEVIEMTGHEPSRHQVNLADDPEYAQKRTEMERLLLEQMRRHNDPYRLWDQPEDDDRFDD